MVIPFNLERAGKPRKGDMVERMGNCRESLMRGLRWMAPETISIVTQRQGPAHIAGGRWPNTHRMLRDFLWPWSKMVPTELASPECPSGGQFQHEATGEEPAGKDPSSLRSWGCGESSAWAWVAGRGLLARAKELVSALLE